jgi:type III pantothenate kinase
MLLLIDIGNTNTHLGLANAQRVVRQRNIPTAHWHSGSAAPALRKFARRTSLRGAALCSVVPRATPKVKRLAKRLWKLDCLELTSETVRGVGIDYPKPHTIGPDRLANAVAGYQRFGSPVVIIDFGTAVTFDVVDRAGNFIGGIIAPGVGAMTDYLHEKTALLPRIRIREIRSPIGKSTEEAILAGAVYGYRGLIRQLIFDLKQALHLERLQVVATGGDGHLLASKVSEICAVDPLLTLEGLRLVWQSYQTGGTLKP